MTRETFVAGFRIFVRRYLLWFWYGLLAIELAAAGLRAFGVNVPLVSMVARDQAFATEALPWYDRPASSLVYFSAAMVAHWFVTWRRSTLQGIWATVLGLTFWLTGAAYLVADYLDPAPAYWPEVVRWLRYPPIVAVAGLVFAYVFFAQRSRWTP